MKRFLLVFVLFPLVSFCGLRSDDFILVHQVRVYSFNSYGGFEATSFNSLTVDAVPSLFYSRPLALVSVGTRLTHPSLNFDVSTNGVSSASIDTSIRGVTVFNGSSLWYSPFAFPEIANIYVTAWSLYNAGYRGPAFNVFYETTNSNAFNFVFTDLLSDVMSSTNTVYRQILLAHLSQINSSLSSIGSSVGTINQDYQTVNNLYLDPTYQNLVDSIASPFATSSGASTIYGNAQSLLGGNNQYLGASSQSEVVSALAELSRRNLQAVFSATLDPDSEFFAQPIDDILGNQEKFSQAVAAGGGGSALANIMRDVKKLSTNDWVAGVTNQLANNRASITNQLAHMFDDDTSVGSKLGNIEAFSSQSASAAGSIDERLARGITVAVVNSGANSVLVSLDGPVNIDQTQFNSLSVPLGSLQNTVSDWYSDWYSFFSVSSPVYKWENFYNMVSAFKDDNHTDLVSLLSCVSNLLLSLHGDITNSVVSTNGYLLLSDYADYIHSGGLDTLLDVMDDDSYSDLKSEIDSLYHADASEGYGRWWRYFTGLSTVQANGIFRLSNIFLAHEKLLKDLKRDNSDLDVQDASDPSVFRKLLYSIPSEEDTFNKLAQLTNSIDQSGMVRVQSLIPDLTNSLSSAASLFDKDFRLPTEISWELIPADASINSQARIVTIRPYDHYRLFQMLHYGLAFSYCIVNLILFPKFLLLLVRLFDRVWNKSEKLIYNSTQS